jgi:hypothetical protein
MGDCGLHLPGIISFLPLEGSDGFNTTDEASVLRRGIYILYTGFAITAMDVNITIINPIQANKERIMLERV